MATYHSGIITGQEAEKLYSYPTLPAAGTSDTTLYLAGNGTFVTVPSEYFHPTLSATFSELPNQNLAPNFGDVVTLSSANFDTLGHVTAVNNWQVTIPGALASTVDAGLMSAADKIAVDGIASLEAQVASLAGLLSETLTGSLDEHGNLIFTRSNGSSPITIALAGFY